LVAEQPKQAIVSKDEDDWTVVQAKGKKAF
jgi:hypothetical protein